MRLSSLLEAGRASRATWYEIFRQSPKEGPSGSVPGAKQGFSAHYPWVVAFTFGLLHGFGFAGALGLPQNEVPLALLMFNVGVEIGQLLFFAVILAIVLLLNRLRRKWPTWFRQVPAYGVGGIAAYWLIERVAGF